jgi:hypothetical protein
MITITMIKLTLSFCHTDHSNGESQNPSLIKMRTLLCEISSHLKRVNFTDYYSSFLLRVERQEEISKTIIKLTFKNNLILLIILPNIVYNRSNYSFKELNQCKKQPERYQRISILP